MDDDLWKIVNFIILVKINKQKEIKVAKPIVNLSIAAVQCEKKIYRLEISM